MCLAHGRQLSTGIGDAGLRRRARPVRFGAVEAVAVSVRAVGPVRRGVRTRERRRSGPPGQRGGSGQGLRARWPRTGRRGTGRRFGGEEGRRRRDRPGPRLRRDRLGSRGDRRCLGSRRDRLRSGRRARGRLRVRSGPTGGAVFGRIGLARVGPADRDGQLRLRSIGRVFRLVVLREEAGKIDRVPSGAQLGERPEHGFVARPTLPVGGEGVVGSRPENAAHEARQHRTGPHLDEGAGAAGVHGLHHLHEPNRGRELRGERLPDALRVRVVRGGCGVRVHRDPRRRERELGERGAKRRRRFRDDLRVKRGRHREAGRTQALLPKRELRRFDAVDRAGDHHLLGGVVVGDRDVEPMPFEHRPHPLDRRRDREHAAWGLRCLGHQLASAAGDPEQVRFLERAGGEQGRDLPEAVAGHHLGLEPGRPECGQRRDAGRPERGLGPLGAGEQGSLRCSSGLVEGGRGEHDPVQGLLTEPQVRRTVPGSAGGAETHRQLRPHVRVLASLPREQEREARPLRSRPDEGVGCPRDPAIERGERLFHCGEQLVLVLREQHRPLLGEAKLRLRAMGEHGEPPRPDLGLQPGEALGELLPRGGRQRHDLHRQGPAPGGAAGRRFEHDVKVRAPEPEAADRGPTGVVAGSNPREGAGGEVKRRAFERDLRVRAVDLDRRGDDGLVDRHHRFEQPGRARRRLGVADLGLHRAERAPRGGGVGPVGRRLPEHLGQAGEFGRVAGAGAGAVGFHQLDRLWTESGRCVGPAKGSGLPLRERRIHALGSPVGARADPADDGVDAVFVPLGVGEALQGEHADAFTEHRPVAGGGKGPTIPGRGQSRGLREAHEHEDVVHGVHAPDHGEVRIPEPQLVHRHRKSGEGRGAGRVGDAVGAAEIEAVCDAPGHDVSEQAGEGRLLPRSVVGADAVAGFGDFGLGQSHLP